MHPEAKDPIVKALSVRDLFQQSVPAEFAYSATPPQAIHNSHRRPLTIIPDFRHTERNFFRVEQIFFVHLKSMLSVIKSSVVKKMKKKFEKKFANSIIVPTFAA
ncbi:MAG: hypothetical protein LBD59_09835 [Prevotellaceae bacterium]|jgi:hypothetical protein|nr:hypothetical protein [Prevotellaceae bacterium]